MENILRSFSLDAASAAAEGGIRMLFIRPARGSGKSLRVWERIKEAVENGETVVLVRRDAIYKIDKNGITRMPRKEKQ